MNFLISALDAVTVQLKYSVNSITLYCLSRTMTMIWSTTVEKHDHLSLNVKESLSLIAGACYFCSHYWQR